MIADPGGKLTRVSHILRARVALAGPGRAGRAFARSWTRAGGRISTFVRRSSTALEPAELAGATAATFSDGRFPDCDILVLAVSDDAITQVARSLAPRITCRLAFHLSGALSSEALAPFRDRGASVASLHPVRPFTGADEEDWAGAHVAVEGDAEASAAGEDLARAVGAKPFRLTAEAKPIYHASASLAAGGAVAVLAVAVRGWMAAGIPEHVAREALSDLASRATAAAGHQPFARALTGAVARRDIGTIRSHAAALAAFPEALALYRALAEEILRVTEGRGREDLVRDALRSGPE
jgi:predicted short-subunit dehydrogenase-like oxidoreductase (DUF2520 family)